MINEKLEHLLLRIYFIGITKTQTNWIMLVVVKNYTASWQHMRFRLWNGKIGSELMWGGLECRRGRGHPGDWKTPEEKSRTRNICIGVQCLSVCCAGTGTQVWILSTCIKWREGVFNPNAAGGLAGEMVFAAGAAGLVKRPVSNWMTEWLSEVESNRKRVPFCPPYTFVWASTRVHTPCITRRER